MVHCGYSTLGISSNRSWPLFWLLVICIYHFGAKLFCKRLSFEEVLMVSLVPELWLFLYYGLTTDLGDIAVLWLSKSPDLADPLRLLEIILLINGFLSIELEVQSLIDSVSRAGWRFESLVRLSHNYGWTIALDSIVAHLLMLSNVCLVGRVAFIHYIRVHFFTHVF
jgi:hypothetical protein